MNSRISFSLLIMLFFVSTVSFAQKKMEVGGAIKFDLNSAESSGFGYDFTGINGRFYYYLTDNFRLAPNISINFPYKETEGIYEGKAYVNTYNAQVHYLFDFIKSPVIKPYAIGGLSFNTLKVKASGGGESAEETANDTSFSLGAGVDYQIKQGKLFFEVQNFFGDYKPIVIGFGMVIAIN